MNNRKLFYLLIPTILFMLIGCGGATSPVPVVPASVTEVVTPVLTSLAPEAGINFLIDDAEQTQIKRSGWDNYQPAGFGTAVQRGDLILPSSGKQATILCADLTVHTVDKEDASPCQVAEPRLMWEGARIVNPMAGSTDLPYIIYPRRTAILETRPLLRWHNTGASSYRVAIIQDGKAIWQQDGVRGDQLLYPNDAPALEPGISYLLEIIDEDTEVSSGSDPMKGLGFSLLSPEEVAPIIQTRDEIMALSLDSAAQNFALAVYYAGQGLYGKALAALDEATLTRESPQLLLWKGRLLIAMRLNNDAQISFAAALARAKTDGDVESQAQAQAELWRLTGDEGLFTDSISLYQQLGDEQAITNLQNSH